MSTPCDMQPFIVWMMSGAAERETERREVSCWSEPRAIVTTLVFSVTQLMSTGQRKSSVCQPSFQARRTSVVAPSHATLMLVCQRKGVPEAKLTVARFGEDLSRKRDFSAADVGDRNIRQQKVHRMIRHDQSLFNILSWSGQII